MKKILVLSILLMLVALGVIAARPALVRMEVINRTGENIYIQMDYPYTNLRVPESRLDGTSRDRLADRNWSRTLFTIQRDTYENVRVYACGGVFTGTLDLNRRLLLNFVPCDEMIQDWQSPRWWGEPSQEKPNLSQAPDPNTRWQFQYLWNSKSP